MSKSFIDKVKVHVDFEGLKELVDSHILSYPKHKKVVYFIKYPIFKLMDVINWSASIWFYSKAPKFTSDVDVTNIYSYKKYEDDIKERTDPDGIYAYNYFPGRTGVDLGDRCIHHGMMLAAESLRLLTRTDAEDYKFLNELVKGMAKFITNEGKLIRGLANYDRKDEKWVKRSHTAFHQTGVSGDQLLGLCFGLAMLNKLTEDQKDVKGLLDSDVFSNLIVKIQKLAERMMENDFNLHSLKTGSEVTLHGYFGPSYSVASGAALSPLAIMNIAHLYTGMEKFKTAYYDLGNKAGYFKLCQFAELHLLEFNNWFGANCSVIGLFAANQGKDNKYLKAGIRRLNRSSKKWGHAYIHLISLMMNGKTKAKKDYVISALHSYHSLEVNHKFKKMFFWSKKKTRSRVLPKRALQDRDLIIQRNPYRDPLQEAPNHNWGTGYGRHGILLEAYLAKYLKIVK